MHTIYAEPQPRSPIQITRDNPFPAELVAEAEWAHANRITLRLDVTEDELRPLLRALALLLPDWHVYSEEQGLTALDAGSP